MPQATDRIASLYDQYWEKEYTPPYLDALLPVFERLGILPHTKVLDIGCGNGALGEFLIQKYHCEMYGTDVSPIALKAASARGYAVENPTADSTDSFRQPFPEVQFDVAVLSAILEHVFDPEALIRHAYSALRDGGHVVILTPNITWLLNRILFTLGIWDHPLMGGTEGHIRYMNKLMLEKMLLNAGFRDLDWSFSPIAVLPPNQDLFVRGLRVPLVRRLVGKRARHWQSLLAENLIVLGHKPIPSPSETGHVTESRPGRIERLKILHIAATASGAGWMVDILRDLRNRGYDVSALISGTQGDLAPRLEQEGIPYHVGELDLFSSPIHAVPRTLRLANFLRKHRFDIVHYHLFSSVISGRIAAYLADVPLRYSMITGPYHLEAPAPSRIDCKTVWMDTKVIASCEYTRQLYRSRGVPWQKIERIYYGADESRFDPARSDPSKLRRELGIPKGASVVGMVAYFYAPLPRGPWTPPHLQGRGVKGHETFLQAAQIVLRKNPKAKFVLVGKGWGAIGEQYETRLKTSAREMGLDKSVMFAGARPDVPDVLASFDVSVQCSLNENLGGTIESLLMARPTIATAVGGMTDSVRDWQTGLLVPPDDRDELVRAILTLLNNRQTARVLGQNGRRLMLREFTLTKTVDDIDRLYQSSAQDAIARRRPRSAELKTRYYRSYRILRNFCALTVVLPIVFLPLFIGQLISPFRTAAATLIALPIWTFVRFARRYDRKATIFSLLRRTQRLIPPLQKILVHAHIGRLDFSGLTKNLEELARRIDRIDK